MAPWSLLVVHGDMAATSLSVPPLSNTEISRRLVSYAHGLQTKGDNPYKIRAYRRAAQTIKNLRESVDALIRAGDDVTRFPGIGKGIAAALREIVFGGTLGQMEMPLASIPPEVAAVGEYPALDPKRVARVFKKLGIETVSALKQKLEDGTIRASFGARMADHFRNAFRDSTLVLLDDADQLAVEIERFLLTRCNVTRAELAGDVRRRVESISEIVFVIETDDFSATLKRVKTFRGGIDLIETAGRDATFQLPGSVMLTLHGATSINWGTAVVLATGSPAHLQELEHVGGLARRAKTENDVYATVGLSWVPPELREGRGEVALAAKDELPRLVELNDIRGDLHMHTTSSDGLDTIEAMAEAARARGYDYLGITDHSQSLKIARGVSIENLWAQIRRIDKLNARLKGIRILKSAEVDILADGSLDYPDDLLAELDYTICSIHSRFALGKQQQTERVMRAMDHPAFTMLGHATGRLILHRSGYELDLPRIIAHAAARRCYFEINADPDRLDLSSDNVRLVAKAGIKVAIGTDAHRVAGLDYMHCGIDVARRAGLTKKDVLNTGTLAQLQRAFRR
ncbi:MAG TPA: PHP domain-containing protein [Opitutaceae bacterium]|nr:PHP domain-containing protein [Opitutaceae bacterium]